MVKPKVVCHVNTCTHHLPGDLCGASGIHILNQVSNHELTKSDLTECNTFHFRGGLIDYTSSMDNVNWGALAGSIFTSGARNIHPSITCSVDNCQYWSPGKLCHADAIEVTGDGAQSDSETNCRSFLERE